MKENFVFRQIKETVMTMDKITTIITETLEEIDKFGNRSVKDCNKTISVTKNKTDVTEFGRAA